MNVQTFLYNEHFYEKFALAVAIIRLTPCHLTPKEFTQKLREIVHRHRTDESMQFERLSSEIRSLRTDRSTSIPQSSVDLLEHHVRFLQTLSVVSTDMTIECQIIIIDTIKRLFLLLEDNLVRDHVQMSFQNLIQLIFNYDIIVNIQEQTVRSLHRFLDVILSTMKQSTTASTNVPTLIEHIGIVQRTRRPQLKGSMRRVLLRSWSLFVRCVNTNE